MIRLAILLAALLPLAPAPAAAGGVTAKLKLYFAGLPVGRFKYEVVGGAGYRIVGRAETSGIAKVFARTTASFVSSGSANGAVVPAAHSMTYRSDDEDGSLKLGFSGGGVAKVEAVPPPKPRNDRVAVTAAHLKGVLDPVSALVIAAAADADLATVCNRTLPVYDGQNRFDLVLSPKRSAQVKVRGYRGPVHTCAVRYVPVSGHRTSRESVKRMARTKGIEIGFALAGGAGLWALHSFRVPTRYGPATGDAYSFKAS